MTAARMASKRVCASFGVIDTRAFKRPKRDPPDLHTSGSCSVFAGLGILGEGAVPAQTLQRAKRDWNSTLNPQHDLIVDLNDYHAAGGQTTMHLSRGQAVFADTQGALIMPPPPWVRAVLQSDDLYCCFTGRPGRRVQYWVNGVHFYTVSQAEHAHLIVHRNGQVRVDGRLLEPSVESELKRIFASSLLPACLLRLICAFLGQRNS